MVINKMIKPIIASTAFLIAGTFCGVAQAMPGQSTIGSTITVQEFRSTITAESSSWGEYQEFGFDVNAGSTDSATITIDFADLTGGLGLSGGSGGSFSAYTLDGGFLSESSGRTVITGNSITAESYFK